jgi:predicted aspartyl protease
MSRPFPFNPSRPLIVVDAEMVSADRSFRHNMTLALDTGASRTMISWPIASRLGYKPEFSPLVERTKIVTGSGIEYVPEITTTEICCLGKALRRLPVLVHDLPAEIRVDGLLGLDFLRRFRLTVDFKKGLISLR